MDQSLPPRYTRPQLLYDEENDCYFTPSFYAAVLPNDMVLDLAYNAYPEIPYIAIVSKAFFNYFDSLGIEDHLDAFTRYEHGIYHYRHGRQRGYSPPPWMCCPETTRCRRLRIADPALFRSWPTETDFGDSTPPITSPRLFRLFRCLVDYHVKPVSLNPFSAFEDYYTDCHCNKHALEEHLAARDLAAKTTFIAPLSERQRRDLAHSPTASELRIMSFWNLVCLSRSEVGNVITTNVGKGPDHSTTLMIEFAPQNRNVEGLDIFCHVTPPLAWKEGPYREIAEMSTWISTHKESIAEAVAAGVDNMLDYFKFYFFNEKDGFLWSKSMYPSMSIKKRRKMYANAVATPAR
jgi:hypothetical protein